MNTVYDLLVEIVGEVPAGYEYIAYTGAMILTLMFFKLCIFFLRCLFGLEK